MGSEREQIDIEAVCRDIFLHAHWDGWIGNQTRRDAQQVDAKKCWELYVHNGALKKTLARHLTTERTE